MNHWVHMEMCHLVNMVPGLLMILAGKQGIHRLGRKTLSLTITPVLSLFYVLQDHSGLRDLSLIIGQLKAYSICCFISLISVQTHRRQIQTCMRCNESNLLVVFVTLVLCLYVCQEVNVEQ